MFPRFLTLFRLLYPPIVLYIVVNQPANAPSVKPQSTGNLPPTAVTPSSTANTGTPSANTTTNNIQGIAKPAPTATATLLLLTRE